jgi:branched-chain amino acid transport system ATP-binding protein
MLEIENLTVQYGSVVALHKVDLCVGSNEVVALIGNNGAGKTTTLRTISGLLKPTTGSITFNGKSLVGMPVHKIVSEGIIHVPEGRKIFAKLTIKENLLMGAYSITDKAVVSQSLKQVMELFPVLEERVNQLGGTLSGGEQQMLAIGRGMMASPKMLLLDEPSLGLAPQAVDKIADTIIGISKLGIPILLVEQNANLALELSNRAYVIETGHIELTGKSSELLANDMVRKTYLGVS